MKKFLFILTSLALYFSACNNANNENKLNENKLVIPEEDGVIPNAVTDIDGNTYKAVKLGDQIWMAENLKTKRYSDGTAIHAGNDESSDKVGYWYYPIPELSNISSLGLLYNWKAVIRDFNPNNYRYKDTLVLKPYKTYRFGIYSSLCNIQGICPNGWHVPSEAEWVQLANYVSSQSQYVCGTSTYNIAKALAATTGWVTTYGDCEPGHDKVLNNSTGFAALPNDILWADLYYADFWSSSIGLRPPKETATIDDYMPFYFEISNWKKSVYMDVRGSHIALSVRCIRD